MVIFGIQSRHLTSVKTRARYCTICTKNDTIVLNVFRKQMYLFGIPTFVVGKTGNAFCESCKTVVEEDQMSEFIKHEYLVLKNQIKEISWQPIIALLFLGTAIAVSLVNHKTNTPELVYLTSPKQGDIYEYKMDETYYSTMKIIKVGIDSLYVSLNKQKIDKSWRIDNIDKNENYTKIVAFERQQINDMYNQGQILEIYRTH